jgi:hypothetical protein
MTLPLPLTGVNRDDVGTKVNVMLGNPDVNELDIHEDPDGTFTIVPRGASSPPSAPSAGPPPAPKRKTLRKDRQSGNRRE